VAFISEQDLNNPHIEHFEHLNPEWNKVRSHHHFIVCSGVWSGSLSGLYGKDIMDRRVQWCIKDYQKDLVWPQGWKYCK